MYSFRLFRQERASAFCLALFSAGSSMAARMAMIAITTRSSISVKYLGILRFKYEISNMKYELAAVFFFILLSFEFWGLAEIMVSSC